MQKLAYTAGQQFALKKLNLIKLGNPQKASLDTLRAWIAKNPVLAASGALGTGYGLSSLVSGKRYAPPPPHTYAPPPMMQGTY